MTLMKKFIIGLLSTAAMAAGAHASPINVGGVVFDPDSEFDFSGTTAAITQLIDGSTGALSGYGIVTRLNGLLQPDFCPSCELTLQYSGFLPVAQNALPGLNNVGTQIQYKGGSVRLYVDSTPDTNSGKNVTAMNSGDADGGVLWADFIGHPVGGVTFKGFNLFPDFLQGGGLLDIVGGLAFGNLNTNSKTDGADISFTTTLTQFPTGTPLFSNEGAGTFSGNSIPEPGSLALVGLGILGAAFVRRRRST